MNKNNVDLERIEAYLKNQMSFSDRQFFEQELKADEKLRTEVEVYRELFLGLKSLSIEELAQELASEVKKKKPEPKKETEMELIESYLHNKLSIEQKQAVEAELAENPELGKEVEQYQLLFHGFKALRIERLAQEMRSWSKSRLTRVVTPKAQQAKVFGIWRIAAVAASLILILGLGLKWYASNSLGDQALADTFFEAYFEDNTLSAEKSVSGESISRGFEKAEEAFNRGDFEMAANEYTQLKTLLIDFPLDPSMKKAYLELAEWNQTLAMLLQDPGSEQAKMKLNEISRQQDHSFNKKANELKAKVDNPLWFLR